MTDFLFDSSNLPFTVALGIMIGIGLVEAATAMFGGGLGSLIDSLVPDADIDVDVDVDMDVGADADLDGAGLGAADHDGGDVAQVAPSTSSLIRVLGWLHVGRVPVLMLLVIFLLSFGLGGLAIQSLCDHLTGHLLPGLLASIPAFFVAVGSVRVSGSALARVMPRDETEAVSEHSFIGRVAHVVLGTARRGRPVQAKLKDQFGRTHYLMVEPDDDADELPAGIDVLVVRRAGAVFYAIRNISNSLVDVQE